MPKTRTTKTADVGGVERLSFPIRRQTMLTVSGLVLLAVFIQVAYYQTAQSRRAWRTLEAKANSISLLVAHDIKPGLEFGDADSVAGVFEGAILDEDVVFLRLHDAAGSVLSEAGVSDGLDLASGNAGPFRKQDNSSVRIVEQPVATELAGEGLLQVGFRTDSITSQGRRDLGIAIALGTLLVFLGAVAALVHSAHLSRRLGEVTAVAERIERGDLGATTGMSVDNPRDEIDLLDRAMNRMELFLQETAKIAERVAEGDLTQEVTPALERRHARPLPSTYDRESP